MGDEPAPGRWLPHPAQSGLLAAGPPALNSSCAYLVRGPLDPARLADAYSRALAQFDALRLTWSAGPEPGWVAGLAPRAQVSRTDLRGEHLTSRSKPSRHLNELLERHARTPFDPASGPAGTVDIWHLADGTWAVAEAFTHLLADGRSLALLHEAVAAAYSDPAAAPHRSPSYARILAHAPARAADERFWRDAFAGYQAPAAAGTGPGGPAADWAATLTAADTARLEHAAGQSRATLATALLAAHAHGVARHCGTGDITTHLTIDTRAAADLNVFGQLTTALPLRLRHDWAMPVTQHLTAVTRAVLTLREHAHARADALAELGIPVAMSSPDVTAFVMQPYATAPDLPGCLTSVIPLRSTDQAGGLATVARPAPDGSLTVTLRAAPGSSLARLTGSIGATILATLDAITCRPSTLLGSDSLLPAQARKRIRATATPAAAHPYQPLGTDITGCLAALGPREVLADGQQSHSAASMLERINAAEQRMFRAGTREGDTVMAGGLLLADRIAAYAATLRLGAVYLPFGTVQPPLEDGAAARAATLVTAAGTSRCPGPRVAAPGPGPLAPAYVIYTSGSSGRPKGVIVSRQALSNLARGEARRFGIGPDSRILLVAPPDADPWICHVTAALLTGATIVAGDPSSGSPLAEQIRAAGVTHAFLPAALLRSLGTRALPSLQVIASAGDTCWAADLAGFGQARVFNIYGPTEATVTATVAEITSPADPVPIGRPIRGLGARVLIDRAADAPPGAPGELIISGAGVADGYLNDPVRTRDAFRFSPADPRERWYCTGDLARLDPGGDLFHLGRIDRQVKIRGWRVGLDALEAAARASGLCGDARAMAHTVPSSPDTRLVLFAERCPDTAALHAELRRTVPAPSVPHRVTAVDTLPRQASGKIDDSKLAADYEAGRQAEPSAAGPAGALARAWTEVLGAPPRRRDSFFDSGGDSLNVLSLVLRARQEGLDLDPADVYANPEYHDLDLLCHDRRRAFRPAPEAPPACLPLGPSQQWLLAMNPGDLAAWTQSRILSFAELPSPGDLRHALNALAAATPVLRSALAGSGFLTVLPEVHLRVTMTDADAPDAVIRQAISAARGAVDPQAGMMMSAAAFRGKDGEGAVLLTAHHLITDTWSWPSIEDRLRLALADREVPLDQGFAVYATAVARQVSAGAYDLEADLWRGVLTAGRTAALNSRPASLRRAEITIPEARVLTARWAAPAPHVLLGALGDALNATLGAGATVIDLERNGRASVAGLDLSSAAGWIALHHPLPVSHRPLSHESIADLRQGTDSVSDFGLGYSALRWLRGTDLGGRVGRLAVNITEEPAAPGPGNQAARRVRSLISAPGNGRDLPYHGTLTFSRGDGETIAALDFDPGQIPAVQASGILAAVRDAAVARRPARSKPSAAGLPGPAAITVPATAMQQMMLHHAGSVPGAYLPRQVLQISSVSSHREFLDAASTFLGGIEPFNRRFRINGGRIVQEWLKAGPPLRASIRSGGRQAALAWISSQSTLANGEVLRGRGPAELTAFHEKDTLYLGIEVHHALIDGVSNAQVITLVEELAERFPAAGRQFPDQSAWHQSAVRKHAACELAAGPAIPAPPQESPDDRSAVATQEMVLDAGQVLRISEWAAAHRIDLRAALAAVTARAGRVACGASALYAVVNGRDPDIPGSADALGMFWYFYETPIGDCGLPALARSAFSGAASPLSPVRAAALRWAAWDSSGTSFNFTKQAATSRPEPRVAVIASRDTFHFAAQVHAVLRSDGSVKLVCTVAGDLSQLTDFPGTVARLAAGLAASEQATGW